MLLIRELKPTLRREWRHEDSETSVHIADFILVYIYNLIFLDNDCL